MKSPLKNQTQILPLERTSAMSMGASTYGE